MKAAPLVSQVKGVLKAPEGHQERGVRKGTEAAPGKPVIAEPQVWMAGTDWTGNQELQDPRAKEVTRGSREIPVEMACPERGGWRVLQGQSDSLGLWAYLVKQERMESQEYLERMGRMGPQARMGQIGRAHV